MAQDVLSKMTRTLLGSNPVVSDERHTPKRRRTPHPHRVLELLVLSQYRLAKNLYVRPRRVGEIVRGKHTISAATALRR